MKKLVFTLVFGTLFALSFNACTADEINSYDEQATELTEKNKICPPSNPNCNG